MLIWWFLFKLFSHSINCIKKFIYLSTVVIFVNNMKHPSKFITMNMLNISYSYSNFQLYNFIFVLLVDRQVSTTPRKWKIQSSEQFCKKIWIKTCGSKLVGTRCFFLSRSLLNSWHTIVLTGVSMKPPNYIN